MKATAACLPRTDTFGDIETIHPVLASLTPSSASRSNAPPPVPLPQSYEPDELTEEMAQPGGPHERPERNHHRALGTPPHPTPTQHPEDLTPPSPQHPKDPTPPSPQHPKDPTPPSPQHPKDPTPPSPQHPKDPTPPSATAP
uniref:Uncharacterized protein n=1 Tax=Knipowitschia caucasica TaxID=637954 RepID=A0AAV2MLG6_KNICA